MNRKDLLKELHRIKKMEGSLAKKRLSHFANYVVKEYELQWFHKIIFDTLQDWIEGKIQKLAIFVPPQHGKSMASSVLTPAYILGQKPNAKIAVCSYSDELASKFNRDCQDIINTPEYKEIFPGVVLPGKGIEYDNELKNNKYFEIVKHKGFFKAVSLKGQLTGNPVDYGIIDDPIKDRKQANSQTYRDDIWDFYTDVFKARLHNGSCQLMLFTRWHADDLAGRLFDPKNKHYDAEEASEWKILCFQALKEEKFPIPGAYEYQDPRKIGEALWQNKHSREKHEKTKRTSPITHASLNQQRPSAAKGNKFKREWFQVLKENQLPFNKNEVAKNFMIDGAFTEKMENDESAQMSYYFDKVEEKLYIFNCTGVRKELSKYLPFIVGWLKNEGYNGRSTVSIEKKASGYGFMSMLQTPQYGNHNCVEVDSKVVSYGKLTRAEECQPFVASGKVVLVEGGWNEAFLDQVCNFPNDTHDDMLDCLCYAIYKHYLKPDEVFVTYSHN